MRLEDQRCEGERRRGSEAPVRLDRRRSWSWRRRRGNIVTVPATVAVTLTAGGEGRSEDDTLIDWNIVRLEEI